MASPFGPGASRREGFRPVVRWAVVPLVALLVLGGALAAPAPRATAGGALAITQSSRVSEQQTFTVSIEVADPTNVTNAYFLFCQLTSSVCYLPVTMTLHDTNWFSGTTKPMSSYHGMAPGVVAGYNISVDYRDLVNVTYPALPNTFSGLTIATTVVGEYMYEMSVAPLVFGLNGVVHDSGTGAAIAGASVTLTNSTGMSNSTTSASTGAYSFGSLPNGTYQLAVSDPGYQTSSRSVTIAGQTGVENVPLTNSSATQHPSSPGGSKPWWSALGSAGGVPLGVVPIVVVVVVLVAVVVLWRRPRSPTSTTGDTSSKAPEQPV
jgi:hypothetical protein